MFMGAWGVVCVVGPHVQENAGEDRSGTVNVVRVPVDQPYVAGARTVDANWHVLARRDAVRRRGRHRLRRLSALDLMTTIGHAAQLSSASPSSA